MGPLALVLRLARREARRRRGRTVTILVTLALPVIVVVAIVVVVASNQLSGAEQAQRQLGPAQASLSWAGVPVSQRANPEHGWAPREESAVAEMARPAPEPPGPPTGLLPPGSTVAPSIFTEAVLRTPSASQTLFVTGEQLGRPVFSGTVELTAGRFPGAMGQLGLTEGAARSLGVEVGGWVDGPEGVGHLEVVGIMTARFQGGEGFCTPAQARVLADKLGQVETDYFTTETTWFVAGPRPVTWAEVQRLNEAGWAVTSREVLLHPPSSVPGYAGTTIGSELGRAAVATTAALLVCMVLLEVVLLAGPAFAVGARRRERELGTLVAAGGGPGHLMGIVLGEAAVLGLAAGVAGVAGGIGAGAALLAGERAWSYSVPGGLKLRWAEIAGVAAVAVVSGLLAALLPALQARRHGALRASRAGWVARRPHRGFTVTGLVLMAAAVVIGASMKSTVVADGLLRVVAVAALGEAALVLLTPAVLHGVGRLGGHLGLWTRMAARDAARRRSAAAPAVAAIMAVVAASAAFMVVGASVAAREQAAYQPAVPVGDAYVEMAQPAAPGVALGFARRMHEAMPRATVFVARGPQLGGACPGRQARGACKAVGFDYWLPAWCPGTHGPEFLGAGSGFLSTSPNLTDCSLSAMASLNGVLAVSPSQLGNLMGGGALGRAAAAALSAGKVVALGPNLVHDGRLSLGWSSMAGPLGPSGPLLTYPAVYVPSPVPVATVAMSASQAARIGPLTDVSVVVLGATRQPAAQLQRASQQVSDYGSYLYVERGFQTPVNWLLLALVGANLVLVLGAAAAATALIGADSRDELVTLAALGAPPGGRRRLSMARAGLIAGLGSAAGTVAGALLGVLATRSLGYEWANTGFLGSFSEFGPFLAPSVSPSPRVPWQLVLLFLVAPMVAAAFGGLLSPGRIPIERRAEQR
jgi:putative ABC transport system permease protein